MMNSSSTTLPSLRLGLSHPGAELKCMNEIEKKADTCAGRSRRSQGLIKRPVSSVSSAHIPWFSLVLSPFWWHLHRTLPLGCSTHHHPPPHPSPWANARGPRALLARPEALVMLKALKNLKHVICWPWPWIDTPEGMVYYGLLRSIWFSFSVTWVCLNMAGMPQNEQSL